MLTIKSGNANEWKANLAEQNRYFSYWSAADITNLLKKAGFSDIKIEPYKGQRADWLNIVAKKEDIK